MHLTFCLLLTWEPSWNWWNSKLWLLELSYIDIMKVRRTFTLQGSISRSCLKKNTIYYRVENIVGQGSHTLIRCTLTGYASLLMTAVMIVAIIITKKFLFHIFITGSSKRKVQFSTTMQFSNSYVVLHEVSDICACSFFCWYIFIYPNHHLRTSLMIMVIEKG